MIKLYKLAYILCGIAIIFSVIVIVVVGYGNMEIIDSNVAGPETPAAAETERIIVSDIAITAELPAVVNPKELEMLACVVYQETGGDECCDDCRRYVADVVLNRIEYGYWGNTMQDVLTAKGQYGNFHWTGVVWPERAKNAGEARAVERAYQIVEEVLQGKHSKLYGQGYIWQAGFKQGTDGFWCCGHWYGR